MDAILGRLHAKERRQRSQRHEQAAVESGRELLKATTSSSTTKRSGSARKARGKRAGRTTTVPVSALTAMTQSTPRLPSKAAPRTVEVEVGAQYGAVELPGLTVPEKRPIWLEPVQADSGKAPERRAQSARPHSSSAGVLPVSSGAVSRLDAQQLLENAQRVVGEMREQRIEAIVDATEDEAESHEQSMNAITQRLVTTQRAEWDRMSELSELLQAQVGKHCVEHASTLHLLLSAVKESSEDMWAFVEDLTQSLKETDRAQAEAVAEQVRASELGHIRAEYEERIQRLVESHRTNVAKVKAAAEQEKQNLRRQLEAAQRVADDTSSTVQCFHEIFKAMKGTPGGLSALGREGSGPEANSLEHVHAARELRKVEEQVQELEAMLKRERTEKVAALMRVEAHAEEIHVLRRNAEGHAWAQQQLHAMGELSNPAEPTPASIAAAVLEFQTWQSPSSGRIMSSKPGSNVMLASPSLRSIAERGEGDDDSSDDDEGDDPLRAAVRSKISLLRALHLPLSARLDRPPGVSWLLDTVRRFFSDRMMHQVAVQQSGTATFSLKSPRTMIAPVRPFLYAWFLSDAEGKSELAENRRLALLSGVLRWHDLPEARLMRLALQGTICDSVFDLTMALLMELRCSYKFPLADSTETIETDLESAILAAESRLSSPQLRTKLRQRLTHVGAKTTVDMLLAAVEFAQLAQRDLEERFDKTCRAVLSAMQRANAVADLHVEDVDPEKSMSSLGRNPSVHSLVSSASSSWSDVSSTPSIAANPDVAFSAAEFVDAVRSVMPRADVVPLVELYDHVVACGLGKFRFEVFVPIARRTTDLFSLVENVLIGQMCGDTMLRPSSASMQAADVRKSESASSAMSLHGRVSTLHAGPCLRFPDPRSAVAVRDVIWRHLVMHWDSVFAVTSLKDHPLFQQRLLEQRQQLEAALQGSGHTPTAADVNHCVLAWNRFVSACWAVKQTLGVDTLTEPRKARWEQDANHVMELLGEPDDKQPQRTSRLVSLQKVFLARRLARRLHRRIARKHDMMRELLIPPPFYKYFSVGHVRRQVTPQIKGRPSSSGGQASTFEVMVEHVHEEEDHTSLQWVLNQIAVLYSLALRQLENGEVNLGEHRSGAMRRIQFDLAECIVDQYMRMFGTRHLALHYLLVLFSGISHHAHEHQRVRTFGWLIGHEACVTEARPHDREAGVYYLLALFRLRSSFLPTSSSSAPTTAPSKTNSRPTSPSKSSEGSSPPHQSRKSLRRARRRTRKVQGRRATKQHTVELPRPTFVVDELDQPINTPHLGPATLFKSTKWAVSETRAWDVVLASFEAVHSMPPPSLRVRFDGIVQTAEDQDPPRKFVFADTLLDLIATSFVQLREDAMAAARETAARFPHTLALEPDYDQVVDAVFGLERHFPPERLPAFYRSLLEQARHMRGRTDAEIFADVVSSFAVGDWSRQIIDALVKSKRHLFVATLNDWEVLTSLWRNMSGILKVEIASLKDSLSRHDPRRLQIDEAFTTITLRITRTQADPSAREELVDSTVVRTWTLFRKLVELLWRLQYEAREARQAALRRVEMVESSGGDDTPSDSDVLVIAEEPNPHWLEEVAEEDDHDAQGEDSASDEATSEN